MKSRNQFRNWAACAALALSFACVFASTSQAGGWGKGPSWRQASKIARQAVIDLNNAQRQVLPIILPILKSIAESGGSGPIVPAQK